MFCSSCGTQLQTNAVFCSQCGARRNTANVTPATAGSTGLPIHCKLTLTATLGKQITKSIQGVWILKREITEEQWLDVAPYEITFEMADTGLRFKDKLIISTGNMELHDEELESSNSFRFRIEDEYPYRQVYVVPAETQLAVYETLLGLLSSKLADWRCEDWATSWYSSIHAQQIPKENRWEYQVYAPAYSYVETPWNAGNYRVYVAGSKADDDNISITLFEGTAQHK